MNQQEFNMQVEELSDEVNEAWERVEQHRLELLEAERLFEYWEEVAICAQEELDELLESVEEDSNNDA